MPSGVARCSPRRSGVVSATFVADEFEITFRIQVDPA
jgi:hypothetical protein